MKVTLNMANIPAPMKGKDMKICVPYLVRNKDDLELSVVIKIVGVNETHPGIFFDADGSICYSVNLDSSWFDSNYEILRELNEGDSLLITG